MFTRTQATGQKSGQIFQLALLLPLMAAVGGITPAHAAIPLQAEQALQASGNVELEGELEVLHVHKTDKTSGYRYFLHTDKGRVEMKFKGKGPRQSSGARLKVKGVQSGNVLALDSSTSSSVEVLAAPAQPNTLGVQNTAVLMVNFQDNQTQSYTKDQVNSIVFGESNSFIKENSSQQTSLSGSVFGWLTLPMAQTCEALTIRDAALQAASNAGVNLASYSRHIIIIPGNSSCTWSGLGTVGGNPSTGWINGPVYRKGITHELGHNLGLYHSRSLECGATTLGSSCTRSEYGDYFDTMGAGEAVHFNAYQKERLGWLNYGSSPAIATVESGSATVTIEPYAATSNGTKAVKVLKSVNATTGEKTWYYLEYRQAINFDSPLANRPGVTSGALVHLATEPYGSAIDLLDMTPNSNSINAYDWNDAPLLPGKTYTDSDGVSLTVLSADSTGATVSVSTSGSTVASCVRANPTVTLSSSQSGSVTPGSAANYTLSVSNADSSACASSTFNLASVVPSGWSGSLGASSLTLSPGTSGSTTLTVTSSSTAANGSYSITANGSNATQSGYQGAASASFSVQATTTSGGTTTTTNLAPVAVSDSAATRIGTAVTITVLGNDYDPEGKALAVTAVTAPTKGKVSINSNGTLTYTPNSKAKGGDSFSYTISDGVNKASTSVAVQINNR